EAMVRHRPRDVPADRSRAPRAQREVHVLVVGEVRRIEDADAQEQGGPDQHGAAARSLDGTLLAAEGGEGSPEVAVPGAAETIDDEAGGVHPVLAPEQQGAVQEAGLRVQGGGLEERAEPTGP